MNAPSLWLDGESTVESSTCEDCGAEYLLVKSFILNSVGHYAIAFAALHHHIDHEAWMDVIFGSTAETPARVTDAAAFIL